MSLHYNLIEGATPAIDARDVANSIIRSLNFIIQQKYEALRIWISPVPIYDITVIQRNA